jgi:hypothetical protein
MTTTVDHCLGRDPAAASDGAVLDRAVDALEARRAADVALLVAAVEWAEANPAGPGVEPSGWGDPDLFGEGFLPLAGEGAPLVAEFAPVELGAVLGWSASAAQVLMGDALEVKHRLPRLWSLVLSHRVPVHLAREVAQQTRPLAYDAARWADRLVCADPAHLSRVRVAALVREARLFHEPDLVVGEEEADLASRHVELTRGRTPATTEVAMKLDTPDAAAFDRAVAQTAEALRLLGDHDPLGVRRARAVGVLADPRRALDLLTAGTAPGPTPAPAAKAAVLWLHLDQSRLLDLDTSAAPVTVDGLGVDGLGTVSSDLLRLWLADTEVVVRPVLDLARTDAVDQHDPPTWMADLVRLRDPHCVFPGCRRRSRRCDLDHVEPYLPPDRVGPPGQTHPLNLAPLCRRHHRAKTHARWRYHRRPDGSYRWTTPTGHTLDVPPPRRPSPPAQERP